MNKINEEAYSTFNVDYSRIETHTLLIWENRDRLTPLRYAHKLNNEIKDSKLILVEGGHTILYQKPEAVIKEIIRNLNN